MNRLHPLSFETSEGLPLEIPAVDVCCLGRGADCHLRFPAPDVSRRHAVLGRAGGEWWLTDTGSKAGTWVNGVRVQHSVRLRDGDRVELGSVKLVFRFRGGAGHSGSGGVALDPTTQFADADWFVTADRAALWVDGAGEVVGGTGGALAMLGGFVGGADGRLPEVVLDWFGCPIRRSAAFEAKHDGLRLRIHSFPMADGQWMLVMDLLEDAFSERALERLGISKAEGKVAHWLLRGKRNNEIGTILGLSSKTVEKHVTSVMARLGVETRAAAAWALIENLRAHQ